MADEIVENEVELDVEMELDNELLLRGEVKWDEDE